MRSVRDDAWVLILALLMSLGILLVVRGFLETRNTSSDDTSVYQTRPLPPH